VYMIGHPKRQRESASGRRGKLGPNWVAFGIGLVLLATIVGGQIAIRSSRNPRVVIGNDEVYYYRRATKEDALALGQALKKMGFFNGRGTSVLLWKGDPTVVSFVVNQGAWDHPNAISNFSEIGRRIAPLVGGFPIQVHLIDAGRNVRKQMTVGKAFLGAHDIVYYFGAATEADANALGRALQSAGYFTDSGVTVALLKGEGTVVSFVVQDGVWDEPAAVATLDALVRRIAPAVGGLPIEVRLLDREMGVRKVVTVR
jgi:hypothetical protein